MDEAMRFHSSLPGTFVIVELRKRQCHLSILSHISYSRAIFSSPFEKPVETEPLYSSLLCLEDCHWRAPVPLGHKRLLFF